jgi:hypothetical protein
MLTLGVCALATFIVLMVEQPLASVTVIVCMPTPTLVIILLGLDTPSNL